MVDVSVRSDPDLRSLIRKKKTAIIPVGSTEQHGPHLPVSTDSDIVSEVSRRLAEKMDLWLLPTIRYGVSAEHAPFFQMSLKETTLRLVLADLCNSLLENGIDTVFIINGHHGNIKAIKTIDKKIKSMTGSRLDVHVFSYWHFMQEEFDHAGSVETSLMLAISKNVKMELAEKGLITDKMDRKEIDRLSRIASRSFPEATKNGIWGDPTKATKSKGQAILAEIVENLQKKCQTCLTGNSS